MNTPPPVTPSDGFYWWAQPLATVVSIAVSALMIAWQQKISKVNELKFKLFEELRGSLDEASSAFTKTGITAFGMPGAMRVYRNIKAAGQFAAVPAFRIPAFNELHFEALQQLTALIVLLENYDIVSEHFFLFRRALSCAHSDVSKAFNNLTPALYAALPIDVPGEAAPRVPHPSPSDLANFSDLCNAYWLSSNAVNGYIHDIRSEAQNVLLGGLFTRRVPPRQPADPRYWVLRTDDLDYLERVTRYFTDEHPAAAASQKMSADAFDAATREMEEEK